MSPWFYCLTLVTLLVHFGDTQTALPWYYQTSGTRATPWYLRGSSNNVINGGGGFVQRPPVFDRPAPTTDLQSIVDSPVNNDVNNLLSNLQNTFGSIANDVIGALTTQQPIFANNQFNGPGLPLASAQFNGGIFNSNTNTRLAFERSGLVPYMTSQAPRNVMQVFYSNGNRLSLGNELLPSETSVAPSYISFPSDTRKYYTLVMFDSSPSGSYRGILHWLVMNVPGSNVRRGDTIVEYVPSRPYLGAAGLHNYAFVAFEQSAYIPPYEQPRRLASNEFFGRQGFDLPGFLRDANIIETPVAGNFYVAQAEN